MKAGGTTVSALFQCKLCSKKFKYESDKKRHELSHSPHFKCEDCSKKFSFLSALKRHQKQHERTSSVVCEECGKKFLDIILLKRHEQYAHKGTHVCSKCNATLRSELALRTHMKTHKPETERKYTCSYDNCGKTFNFLHHLKHHELTHTNEKQYFCSICGKGFIQSHHLKTHQKTHDPEKWLYCSAKGCNKKFATEFSRKRHRLTHERTFDSGISSDNYISDGSNSKGVDYVIQQDTLKYDDNKDADFSQFPEDLIPTENKSKETIQHSKLDIDYQISTCKTALGGCIMNGDNCLCAQMSTNVDDQYDLAPIENIIKPSNTLNNIDIIELKQNENDACEGCECAGKKNIEVKNTMCPSSMKTQATMPDIEYRIDGTVKIRETFDMDLSVGSKKEAIFDSEMKFVPYNSCKAVLGNCIVSGNGTMGEGCLCAKMDYIMDEQQFLELEIEDIIPHPKV